jgi:hypothetical protein
MPIRQNQAAKSRQANAQLFPSTAGLILDSVILLPADRAGHHDLARLQQQCAISTLNRSASGFLGSPESLTYRELAEAETPEQRTKTLYFR